MTLKEAYEAGKDVLEQSKIQDAALDAWYLLEYVTGVGRTVYFAEPGKKLEDGQYRDYMALIRKRAAHIPLQHLTGEQEFMGLSFRVNEDVLIPRQDTETLVETALELFWKGAVPAEEGRFRVLDLCTGSGCILISLLYYLQKKGISAGKGQAVPCVEGTGTDISGKALAVAETNAAAHQVDATFVQGSLFEPVCGSFGLIVSNPPYIRTAEIARLQEEVRLHDPVCALDGKEDGLYFYRRIVKESRQHLKKGGLLIFEIGYDQAREVKELMETAGFSDIRVRKDLAGLDRVVSGRYDNEWKG